MIETDEILSLMSTVLLKHRDSGEASTMRGARLVHQALVDAGYAIVKQSDIDGFTNKLDSLSDELIDEFTKLKTGNEKLMNAIDKMKPLIEGELLKYDIFPPKDELETAHMEACKKSLVDDDDDICHICGAPNDKKGGMFCSAAHSGPNFKEDGE